MKQRLTKKGKEAVIKAIKDDKLDDTKYDEAREKIYRNIFPAYRYEHIARKGVEMKTTVSAEQKIYFSFKREGHLYITIAEFQIDGVDYGVECGSSKFWHYTYIKGDLGYNPPQEICKRWMNAKERRAFLISEIEIKR